MKPRLKQNKNSPFKKRPSAQRSASFRPKPKGSPSRKLLGHLLSYHGVEIDPEKLSQLWEYHQMLREANTDSDLTRLHAFDTIAERHYADCLLVRKISNFPFKAPLLDIGSGAGFPGIILKIQNPSLKLILAEPRPRRVAFLETVIKKLSLDNIEVFPHRVTPESFKEKVEATICRAFASMQKTIDISDAFLPKGALSYFMKGPAAPQEVAEGIPKGYKLVQNAAYPIPNSQQKRALLVLKKI